MFDRIKQIDVPTAIATGFASVGVFAISMALTKNVGDSIVASTGFVKGLYSVVEDVKSVGSYLKERYDFHYQEGLLDKNKHLRKVGNRLLKLDAYYSICSVQQSIVQTDHLDITVILFYQETEQSKLEKFYLTFPDMKTAKGFISAWEKGKAEALQGK